MPLAADGAARNTTAAMESMKYLTAFGIRRFRFRVGVSPVDSPMVGSRFEFAWAVRAGSAGAAFAAPT